MTLYTRWELGDASLFSPFTNTGHVRKQKLRGTWHLT